MGSHSRPTTSLASTWIGRLTKNTLVGLAGQKAWHICAGEAAPRTAENICRRSCARRRQVQSLRQPAPAAPVVADYC
jgi:hypothetical protein